MIGPWARPRGYRVPYRTLEVIRAAARAARENLRIETGRIDMVDLLERKLRNVGINFHIVENETIPGEIARAIPDAGLILLTPAAYDAIHDGDPDHELLVAHEFGHIVLRHAITFARASVRDPHVAMEDSEVQADLFSLEFAVPVSLVQRYCQSVDAIRGAFNVSRRDAEIRADMLRRERLITW